MEAQDCPRFRVRSLFDELVPSPVRLCAYDYVRSPAQSLFALRLSREYFLRMSI
jgi:hypothetical protein